jgi:hypothetical protein
MSRTTTKAAITLSLTDLENIVRRVVRETVHDELTRVLRKPDRSVLEYWEHEGPDDPAGDKKLLAEALAVIQEYEKNPEGWKTLEEFEAELARAEAAHELPS